MKQFKGKTALVTGASSGLGSDFATILAEQGCHLVLVARREDRLIALKEKLQGLHKVEVRVIAKDLSNLANCQSLVDSLEQLKVSVDVLINNAGFGSGGAYVDQSWSKQHEMMRVNMDALAFLSHHFGQQMAANGGGYILQVSSVGGFTPCPGLAVYDATKAFVLVFGETLHYELARKNVVVSTLCPGATATEFFDVAGQKLSFMIKRSMMPSRRAAEIGLKGLAKRKMHIVPSLTNKLAVWSMKFTPRSWLSPIANMTIATFE